MFIHSRCVRLLECLPSLQHDPNRPEDVLKVDADEDGRAQACQDDSEAARCCALDGRTPLNAVFQRAKEGRYETLVAFAWRLPATGILPISDLIYSFIRPSARGF